MSNRINGPFGASNPYSSEVKKEKAAATKQFGEFIVEDQDDDINPQAQSSEEDLGGLADDLGTIFGFGSSSSGRNNDSGSSRSNSSRPRPDDRNVSEPETDDRKPANKIKQKPKVEFDKFAAFGEEQPQKLKDEEIKVNPLAAFSVPAPIERSFSPAPIQPTSTVIPPQMMEQIVQDVRLGINELGVAEFQFDLKSDALDGLKLKISTKDGQVYATFIAENVHVKDNIDQGAQELIKALQDKGLEVASFQVSVGADSGGNSGFGGSNQGDSNQQQNQRRQSYSETSSAVDERQTSLNTTNTDYTV